MIKSPKISALMRMTFHEMINGVREFVLGIMNRFRNCDSFRNIISFQRSGKGIQ